MIGHTQLSQGYHDGKAIDISDSNIAGAKVIAAIGGTVTHIFTCTLQHNGNSSCLCNGFGTGVIIQGNDGRIYQYAHMKAASIPSDIYVGASVYAGQHIGAVGTTGNFSGYHLHFGISTGKYWYASGINPQNESYIYGCDPQGCLDQVTAGSGCITASGWAFDPDYPTTSIEVHVYIGDEGHNLGATNKTRTDVASVYSGIGNSHGFNSTITTSKRGNQTISVYAINIGTGGNVLLGQETVDIGGYNPQGHVDNLTGGSGTVMVRGWAFDMDYPTTSIQIHVYIGDEGHNLGIANKTRADVAKVYSCVGNSHGFESTITTKKRGNQTVSIYAINAGTGGNTLLYSKTVYILTPATTTTTTTEKATSSQANNKVTKSTTVTSNKSKTSKSKTGTSNNITQATKSICILSCKAKSGKKKITGKLNVKNAIVKIKVGSKKYKKVKVKNKKFTLKTGKLKKGTIIFVRVKRTGYKSAFEYYKAS